MLSETPFQGPFSFQPVLVTDHRIAYESPDHLQPCGTANDNFRNPRFNDKVFELFGLGPGPGPLKVLDIGCSGGGFVKDMVDAGHFAMGLEGSDYSQRHKRAEWATIPGNLTTGDAAKPYDIFSEQDGKRGERIQFDLITAWEVLEHIHERDLGQFLENIRKHLDPKRGLFIGSVAYFSCVHNGVELHQTIQPDTWWIGQIEKAGFRMIDPALLYFDLDWLRGPLQGSADRCFHVVFGLPDNTAHDARLLELIARDARQIYRNTYDYVGRHVRFEAEIVPFLAQALRSHETTLGLMRQNEALQRRLRTVSGRAARPVQDQG